MDTTNVDVCSNKILTVEEARSLGVCRICGNKIWQSLYPIAIAFEDVTFNYGDEYAHTRCLNDIKNKNTNNSTST